ncbi:MAG TPA: lytic murein transglycosylase [Sphingomonas sp.]
MRQIIRGALMAALLPWVGPAAAQDEAGFQTYLGELRARALSQGVSARTLDTQLPTLTYSTRVVELDRQQPGAGAGAPSGFTPFAPYRIAHVDAARIGRGRRVYAEQRGRLAAIEAQSGVPGPIMIAIWGHETNYGSYTGNFDLLRSLASLAYEGRRRSLFEGETIAVLRMLDQGVPRSQLKGSWAGATGNPQFLPSVYLRLARDGDGDGRADIWTNGADTLASIANYFRNAGWRAGQPWGIAVTVPAGYQRGAAANRLASPRCPRVFQRHSGWRTMAEWRRAGMVSQGAAWPADTVLATLIEPDGEGQMAYLVTGNYRVILDYNCANHYALSVGLLADAVAR